MKILRISLRNIASLSGLHTVDFTSEPLASAGLFSISGPTGAGKSSLLDALCLALYEKTPRLSRVGRLDELDNGERPSDARTLLRRGASEGMAEVAFVGVDRNPWTARWAVRRARNRADGNLQQSEITLFRGHILPGGEGIVEAGGKKTEVQPVIAEKIGLTFEQFTRAVLLAQNDFATFLKADDKDRAEILQALTGTEIFEGISRSVYERARVERAEVERQNMQLQGQQTLSPEEREAAEQQLHDCTATYEKLSGQLEQIRKQVDWLIERKRLFEALKQSAVRLQTAQQKLQEAEPRRIELEQTERIQREARSLRSECLRLTGQQDNLQVKLNSVRKSHQAASVVLENCVAKLQQAIDQRDQLNVRQTSITPLLRQARELDTRLQPVHQHLKQAADRIAEAQKKLETTHQQANDQFLLQQSLTSRIQTLREQQSRLSEFALFAGEAGLWGDRITAAVQAAAATLRSTQELQAAMLEFQQAEQSVAEQRLREPSLKLNVEQARLEFQAAQAAESKFSPDCIQQRRHQCRQLQQHLTKLQQDCREQLRLQSEQDRLTSQIQTWQQQQQQDELAARQLDDQAIPKAESMVDGAKEALHAVQAAMDDVAERLRSGLKSGQACPVCGSPEHPFVQHLPFADDAVKAAEDNVRRLEKKYRELQDSKALRLAAAGVILSQIQSAQHQLGSINKQLKELSLAWTVEYRSGTDNVVNDEILRIADLSQTPTSDHSESHEPTGLPVVENRLAELAMEQAELDQQDAEFRRASRLKDQCRQRLETANGELTELQQSLAAEEKRRAVAETRLKNCEQALNTARSLEENTQLLLQPLFNGIASAEQQFRQQATSFQTWFAEQSNEYMRVGQDLQQLDGELNSCSSRLELLQKNLKTAQTELDQCQQQHQQADKQFADLQLQRKQVFDGADADDVEQRLSEQLRSAVATYEQAVQAKNDAERALSLTAAEEVSIVKELKYCAAETAAADNDLKQWTTTFIADTGRSLDVPTLDVILKRDQSWVTNEQKFLAEAGNAVEHLKGTVQTHSEQLERHNTVRPHLSSGLEDSEDVILQTQSGVEAELTTVTEQRQSVTLKLHSDDQLRQRQLDLVRKIKAAEQTAEPWLKLADLIGSADGNKFRMIAQRRTLDILLGYANAHLQQLSGRYRLDRLPESLNLIVVDRDMAEERRSVHSLSGGESFLVSLAMALGLASLASNRLRIESLFIDEGFGSLDPETLSTAMNALMHLESQGRKVGVISHVTEMTDAIPVQVKIVKGRNGASRIVIPGARAMAQTAGVEAIPQPGAAEDTQTGMPVSSADMTMTERSMDVEGRLFGDVELPIEQLAEQALQLMVHNYQAGKPKTSLKAIRDHLGCEKKTLQRVQKFLGSQVQQEGRSWRLIISDS